MLAHSRVGWFFLALLVLAVAGGPRAMGQTPVTGETERCTDGEAAGRYPCKNVDLKSYLPIDRLGGTARVELNDIWGWTDPQTGTEYALVGRTDGVAFVDVSDPTNPIYVGELPSHTKSNTWRDVKVYENHAYVVSEASGHGLQVFDLTQLRSVNDPPVTFSETAHYDRFLSTHNIVVNEETGYAYAVGISSGQDVPPSANCGAGLHIIDISTPDKPEFAGCYTDLSRGGNEYTHDAQCVIYRGPDADYQGHEICFNANESVLNVADVTDKSEPKTITNATYPKPGYVHQAWLTEDHRYLLVDDETDESRGLIENTRTLVFDVSDLDAPELVTSYSGETPSSDHNQYVSGGLSYQANYKSGLRILDVSNPESPSEVAYFDSYPSSVEPGFEGAWSVYPFFESGTVVMSSIGEGLFVLEPRLSPVSSLEAKVQGQKGTVQWSVSEEANYARLKVEYKPPGVDRWQRLNSPIAQNGRAGSDLRFNVQTNLSRTGTYQFRVRLVVDDADDVVTDPVSARVLPDREFVLKRLPNPIQGQQTFSLVLREEQEVRVGLYDTMGRRMATLYDGVIEAGSRTDLTLAPPSSGVYFLRVQGEKASKTRKVVVVR